LLCDIGYLQHDSYRTPEFLNKIEGTKKASAIAGAFLVQQHAGGYVHAPLAFTVISGS
jgi:hypothetical protein